MRVYLFVIFACVFAAFRVFANGGELYEEFRKLHPQGPEIDEKGLSPGARSLMPGAHPTGVSEIGLERGGCFGTCPQYTVVIKNDGSVRYFGERYVKHLGIRTGRIPQYYFQQLAEFVRDAGVASFNDDYESMEVTDQENTYTLFVIDGKRKLIHNYAGCGPTALWAIEELIDKLVSETEWDLPEKATHQK